MLRIDYDLVIGNIILSFNKKMILKEDIYKTLEIFEELTNNEYCLCGNNLEDFIDYYCFLFNHLDDRVEIKVDNKILERYFKIGVPKKIISYSVLAISSFKSSKVKKYVLKY